MRWEYSIVSFLTRSHRRLTASFAAAALAFAHVAIAAHACLQGNMVELQPACEEHEVATPTKLLCRTQYQTETQTLDISKLPQVSALDAAVLVFPLECTAPVELGIAPPARIALANAPPPPLNLLYSRFLT